MNIYTIYLARNLVNGKVYVGYDSSWPKRKHEHQYHSQHTDSNKMFYNAIRKYGWDNFEWSVIYQSEDAEHTLKVMENHFIEQYRSYIHYPDSNGYNMTLGGEGTIGAVQTPETRRKISEALKGKTKGRPKRPFTEEHKQNMSKAKKGSVPWNKDKPGSQVPWNKGKTGIHTPENLQKLRAVATGRCIGKFWYNDGEKSYHIFPEHALQHYVKGRIKKPAVTCPHCGKVGKGSNMTRFHFDNCKFKS